MNLLIDTHTLIWFITDSEKLPRKTKSIIESKAHNCFVSIATYWEIGIKNSIGRLNLNAELKSIFKIIEETGFDLLPITTNQVLINASLSFHHQDPFDRIIIAQAISEKMTIVTIDNKIENYDVSTIWEK